MCIKTRADGAHVAACRGRVRKHRAPKGALRQGFEVVYVVAHVASESTERQKVH